jgi:hypothetical protein
MMKLILVHLIMHFDMQHLEQRPKPLFIGGVIVPPGPVRISIRKRNQNVEDCDVPKPPVNPLLDRLE